MALRNRTMLNAFMRTVIALSTLLMVLSSQPAKAQRLEFVSCSAPEQRRSRSQFRWIRLNQSALADEIKIRQPDAFLGQSEKRLTNFFRHNVTKMECSQDTALCGATAPVYAIGETKMPLPHRYPLTLCMDFLHEDDPLTIALAHQLGRHILINQDKTECTERCTAPNLAVLFSQTTHGMLMGQPFSMEWCLTACAPPREVVPAALIPEQITDSRPALPPNQASGLIDEKPQAPSPNTGP